MIQKEFWIPIDNLKDLEGEIRRLQKKAEKLGFKPWKFRITEEKETHRYFVGHNGFVYNKGEAEKANKEYKERLERNGEENDEREYPIIFPILSIFGHLLSISSKPGP